MSVYQCRSCKMDKDEGGFTIGQITGKRLRLICKDCRRGYCKLEVIIHKDGNTYCNVCSLWKRDEFFTSFHLTRPTAAQCKDCIKSISLIDRSIKDERGLYCKYCQLWKNAIEENFNTFELKKMEPKCKKCERLYHSKYLEKNIEIVYLKNRIRAKKTRVENPNKAKEYYPRRNELRRARWKNEPEYKLRCDVSRTVNFYLAINNATKKGNTVMDYLPASINEIRIHLENLFSHPDNLTPDGKVWMTWENWGVYDSKAWNDNDPTTWKWQIDHIIPQSELPYDSMEHPNFDKCWSLENLRPLSAKQNVLDGSSMIRHKNKKKKDRKINEISSGRKPE